MEKRIKVNYETIKTEEQKELIKITKDLSKALTKEEYIEIMKVYWNLLNRLVEEAEKQGIEV